ncbi:MAG: hypothetical protein NT079_02515, partial [Candidatus Omnitrophica bacterium]|nr:hypothetical protein [Candidatus Omnitrophota bacterium]
MNLSLGQTNMLLRRLITKGYIRITQLDKRKVQYLLTPKGFSEKMNKSMKYMLKTINSIGVIKERIKALLKEVYGKGERKFFIFGESDLASLVEMAASELAFKDCVVERIKDLPCDGVDGTVLICQEDVFGKIPTQKKIDLINELAKGHVLENNDRMNSRG